MFDYLLQFYWPGAKPTNKRNAPRSSGALRLALNRESRSRVLLLAMVLTFLSIAWSSSAIATPLRLSEHRIVSFDRVGAEEGLALAYVTTITQDRHGFIWIGGQEGLYRYDGFTFESFYHLDSDPDSLSHDWIYDVLEDSKGRLWIGTDDGLNLFDQTTGKFTLVRHGESERLGSRHNSIHALYEDSSGTLWIGTGVGLARRAEDGSFHHYHHDPMDEYSIGPGGVSAIFEDSRQNLWVGTDEGAYRMDRQGGRFVSAASEVADPTGSEPITAVAEDQHGVLWFATSNGGVWLMDFANKKVNHLGLSSGLGSSKVRTLLRDQKGDMWVGTDSGGLHLWHEERQEFTRLAFDPMDSHSLVDNTVLELFQDKGGVIWVGTVNGVSKWNATIETFPHFRRDATTDEGLNANLITSFAEDVETRDIWIGTYEGLSKWTAKTGKFTAFDSETLKLTDDRVSTLMVDDGRPDSTGELWVGTFSGGINIVKDGRVVDRLVHDPQDQSSLSSNAVHTIYRDREGDLWATAYGGRGGGVNLYLGEGRFRHYPDPGNPNGRFSDLRAGDILEAEKGVYWIATNGGGVVVLDKETGNTFNYRYDPEDPTSLSSNNVVTLLRTDDAMWVGTKDGGLNRFDLATSKFRRYTKSDGLASDAVFGILEDPKGRIWVTGSKGLTVLDPRTGSSIQYDSTHGLQGDDFTAGAYLRLSDGSFLFGGNNGFNVCEPSTIRRNTHAPTTQITRFTKFNKPVQLDQPIYQTDSVEIEYSDSVIGFEFAAMDFTAPEKNQFRYKLEGFDRDWVTANNTRQVTYTNLHAGRYTFRVMSSNNEGVWSDASASVDLIVNPPVWATWWAYLVYLVLGIAVLYQAQKANERRLRREAEKRYSERLQLYIESLEEATDCVLIADANKDLMYANNAIKSILDVSPAEAIGSSILSLLFSRQEDANAARHGLQTDGRWHGEVRSRRGPQNVTTEVTIAAVHDDSDNETAYVSIARDVTDRKRTEAELENHRRNLEFLVAERTKALEREIAENKAVQRELANSLQEKELLLKEVHHRVKNNMQVISSLLNIQGETIENQEFANLLGESQQRIKSMSLIHENLYQSDNLLEIDFEDYIRMLANSLCRFYTIPGVTVNLDIQVDHVGLDIETAVPVGLIINELISNSLKHAFKGRQGCGTISVSFRSSGCRYVLQISDDGIGLPPGFEPATSSSMGMEIVSILTQQLDGRLHIEGSRGARFEISFPRKEKVNV